MYLAQEGFFNTYHPCIDEMDKMDKNDRENIHEALEQGTVSIAKGGIVATLNARTAVLAAANPLAGRYNDYATIIENISLPVTLLSRFDLIFLMRDIPELRRDTELSSHVLNVQSSEYEIVVPVSASLLRKYINYAHNLQPTLSKEAKERLQEFYLMMRKASVQGEGTALAICARQLEGLTRLSQAHARVALREQVILEDANAAIAIASRSLEEVGIDFSTGKVDIDILMTGKPKGTQDKMSTVVRMVVELQKATGSAVREEVVQRLIEEKGLSEREANQMIDALLREGTFYEPKEGCIKKT